MGGLWFEVGVWGGRSHEWTTSPVAGRKPLRHSVLRYLCSGLVWSVPYGPASAQSRLGGRGGDGRGAESIASWVRLRSSSLDLSLARLLAQYGTAQFRRAEDDGPV